MSVVLEKPMAKYDGPKINPTPSEYGCEVLLEKTTLDKVKDPSYPKDAHIVKYVVNNEEHMDLCRSGKMVNIFDFYYDKYGPNSVRSIEWGYGKLNPKLWGYKAPSSKGRKK
jgi:hypothetical protein